MRIWTALGPILIATLAACAPADRVAKVVSFAGDATLKDTVAATRPEPEGFGLYVYLLAMPGADRGKVDGLVRGFACNFEALDLLAPPAKPSETALILLPVTRGHPPDSPYATLRAAYSAEYARRLMRRAETPPRDTTGRVFVVASNVALSDPDRDPEAPAVVTDITLYAPDQIADYVVTLRDRLGSGEVRGFQSPRLLMLSYAAAVAEVVRSLGMTSTASAAADC